MESRIFCHAILRAKSSDEIKIAKIRESIPKCLRKKRICSNDPPTSAFLRTGEKYWASGLEQVIFNSSDMNEVIIGLIEDVGTGSDGIVKHV